MNIVEIKGLDFYYQLEEQKIEVLRDLNFAIKKGDFVAIQGPSGSGKSTLFYLLGGMLRPTNGSIYLDGINLTKLTDDELSLVRNRKIGFVFQQFHLLSRTSVFQNILLPTAYPMELSNSSPEQAKARAHQLAERVGLSSHLHHLPNQLSGGQQQRVAIARSLMNDVDLILADEPTGNLDSKNAQGILDVLKELNQQGKTVVIITHDSEVANQCSKIIHLKDGVLVGDYDRPSETLQKTEKVPKIPSNYLKMAATSLPLVMQSLLRQKTKSVLTMLGVVMGIAAVLAMITLGQYTKEKILEGYEALGVNMIVLRGYQNWDQKATDKFDVKFDSFDWDKEIVPLKRIFPEIQSMSPILMAWDSGVTAGGINLSENVRVIGVTPEYLAMTNREILVGKNMSPYHVDTRSPVCSIGFEIAKRLFTNTSPVGEIISVTMNDRTSFPCQVRAVLASQKTNQEWWKPDYQILVPFTYFRAVSPDRWNSRISAVALQMEEGSDVVTSGKKVRSFFQQKYGKSGKFNIDSNTTLVAQMRRFLSLFTILLGSIAFLSLAIGGVGINNMMLVSVTERLKEFGLRKALGATNTSIRIQVLLESLLLCSIAGVLGAAIGFAAYETLIFAASKFVSSVKFEWVIDPFAFAISLTAILAVGVLSGFIPALKAERLQVVEALRSE